MADGDGIKILREEAIAPAGHFTTEIRRVQVLRIVVLMVTTNPSQILGLSDRLGALKPDHPADVSVLSDDRGRFILRNNEDTKVVAERLLLPAFCLRAAKRFDADSPILPQAIAAWEGTSHVRARD
jgi:predicted amidohydrolase